MISNVPRGLEVPIPTLPLSPSMEKMGLESGPEGVEVAKAKALSCGWIVEVAVRLKLKVRSTAEDEAKLITLESKKALPLTDNGMDGVAVAIPVNPR